MRVATSSIYNMAVFHLQNRESDLYKLQNQLSTGRKILTPSDDPVASARSLDLSQSTRLNDQYIENGQYADGTLSLAESNLQHSITVIQSIQQLAIQSGNPALTSAEKKMIEADIRGKYQELLAVANSTDGNGQYLFSGYKGATKPFNELEYGNVTYDGDQGQRLVQISTGRQIPVSDSGADIFIKVKNGNGTFTTAMSQPGFPRSVSFPGGSTVQITRQIGQQFAPSEFRLSYDGTNYTLTRLSDGSSEQFDHNTLSAGYSSAAFGINLQSQTAAPPVNSTHTLDLTLQKNQGTGVVSPGVVVDPVRWSDPNNLQDYRIQFHVTNNPDDPSGNTKITRYDIVDSRNYLGDGVTPNPNYNRSMIDGFDYNTGDRIDTLPATPNAFPRLYKPGTDIEFRQLPGETGLQPGWDFGAKISVDGKPVDGDSFRLQASRNVDLFSTLGDFAKALTSYTEEDMGRAEFQNHLNTALQQLNNSLGNILTTQSNIGARLKEMESVNNTNTDLNLQYKRTISGLTDIDYASAISDFSLTQTYLDAARKSFSSVQGLSLFQYIS
ncbi:flagellar hook-associated protein FlgL [Chitinimonas lacunae]|uniref:Flagellar hook-associated protein FlgL n=1 Tax=Chitinimonas lacunae TaxID=1963018 RepID=A0ABV8MHY8_9NEIS